MEDDGKVDTEESVAANEEIEDLAAKYETLKTQMEQYFDGENQKEKRNVPILKAPQKPTREQWEKHQATHTIRGMVQTLCCSKSSQRTTSK